MIRLSEREGDAQASYDLAVTTHRFSKRAQAVVDDKLSLSATLMRAGEVDEARRLLAEAEEDLRSEEESLLHQIEELGNYRSMHKPRVVVLERDRMSRSSLMRTLAVAVASSAVVALATMGGAVIGLFEQDPGTGRVNVAPAGGGDDDDASARMITTARATRSVVVRINGVRVVLSRSEWRALKRAQRSGDDKAVTDLLGVIAPELTVNSPGSLADIIGDITETTEGVTGGSSGGGSTTGSGSGSQDGTSSGSGSSTSGGSKGSTGSGSGSTGSSKGGGGTTDDGGSGSGTETGISTGTPPAGDIIDDGTGGKVSGDGSSVGTG